MRTKLFNDLASEHYKKLRKAAPTALGHLKGLDWRGNICELRNVVERLVIMSDETISEGDAKAFAGKQSWSHIKKAALESINSGPAFTY